MKGKKRISILTVLVCLLALVLSIGLMSACTDNDTAVSNQWYYGAGDPADMLGNEGDRYLNTQTLASFFKSEDGTWTEMAANWYYGTEEPVSTLGAQNDFYLNTATGALYQKNADDWGAPILTLKGENGRDGVVWFADKGDPNTLEEQTVLTDSLLGDFYLDTENFEVYQKISDTEWKPLGSLMGTGVQNVELVGNKLTITFSDKTTKEFTLASCLGAHQYGGEEEVFVDPTYVKPGAAFVTCDVCGNVTVKRIAPTGRHTYDEDGNCTVCGKQTPVVGGVSGSNYEISGTEEGEDITELYIPGRIDEKPVKVKDAAFQNNTEIQRVIIGNGATIGTNAFYDSNVSVLVFEGDATIGANAFWNTKIEELEINSDITFSGNSAFTNCESLKTVKIGKELKALGGYMFNGCSTLDSVTFEEESQIKSIPDSCFNGCRALSSIVLPSSVTSIGTYAFMCCDSLTRIDGCDNVTSIGTGAFNCEQGDVKEGALQTFSAPNVTSVGENAFRRQIELTELNLGYNAASTKIERWICYECLKLKTLKLSGGVTFNGVPSFGTCPQLTDVYFNGTKSQFAEKNLQTYFSDNSITLYCTDD